MNSKNYLAHYVSMEARNDFSGVSARLEILYTTLSGLHKKKMLIKSSIVVLETFRIVANSLIAYLVTLLRLTEAWRTSMFFKVRILANRSISLCDNFANWFWLLPNAFKMLRTPSLVN
jgi:hypothetical protein